MAKINHNNNLDTIDDLLQDARRKGIIHLNADSDEAVGRFISVNGNNLLNFGTCGYLGLESDRRLKDGVIEYVEKYGTQFSVSRTYLSSAGYTELETLLSKMYNNHPVIVFPSTSTAHIAVIPTIVRDNHAIILDQQVHMSVQTGTQLTRPKGTPVEMIRHSNLEMLERKLADWSSKYDKIWYMIDGVYSMYGDVAPIQALRELMVKYEKLNLYIDDAHGMGWYGTNGAGYIFEQIGVPERVVLVTTLAKGFGVVGGIAIFHNQAECDKVKIFGGPLTYSHPLPPPLLGAAIASAKIHASAEIKAFQEKLKIRIDYCNDLLEKYNLPVVSDPLTPIYFVGMGQPKTGYAMVKNLINDGFYVNIALFPAVSIKCTGLRFTLNNHLELEDIDALVAAIARNYPKVLEETGRTDADVRKAFHLQAKHVVENPAPLPAQPNYFEYTIEHRTSINEVDQQEWDSLLGLNGNFDYVGLQMQEMAFSGNEKPEDNWDFHYYIIRSQSGKALLATFVTVGIYKDDLLAPASVSMQIEQKRVDDPYYLTSKTIGMGSLITEGKHLYIDRHYLHWRKVFQCFLAQLSKLEEEVGASNLLLRDFDTDDSAIRQFLLDEGFVKMDMPNANIVSNMKWTTYDEYLAGLSAKNRAHIRNDVFKYEKYFDVEVKRQLSDEEREQYFNMYNQVRAKNFAINSFSYPKKIIDSMHKFANWEFIVIRLKPEYDSRPNRPAVSIGTCFRTAHHVSPMVLGMDYEYAYEYKVYKQSLFQVVKRAAEYGIETIYFGFSADMDKRKFGAKNVPRCAYLQARDNFNFEVIDSMSVLDHMKEGKV